MYYSVLPAESFCHTNIFCSYIQLNYFVSINITQYNSNYAVRETKIQHIVRILKTLHNRVMFIERKLWYLIFFNYNRLHPFSFIVLLLFLSNCLSIHLNTFKVNNIHYDNSFIQSIISGDV